MHCLPIFTVAEFLDSLAKINGVESNLETALDNVPLIKDKMDLRIEALSDEELALLHVVMFMTIKPYINIWAVPFAPDEYMKKLIDVVGEFNVYIFASDNENECKHIAELLSATMITFVDGSVSEYKN